MKNIPISLLHTAWTEEEKKHIDEAISFVENYNSNNFILDACHFLYKVILVDYILVTVVDTLPEAIVKSLVVLKKGILSRNIQYPLLDSPCEMVFGKEQNYCPGGVQDMFPKDTLLKEMDIQSYLGIPFFDKNGNGLGCLALLHSNIIQRGGFVEALVNVLLPRLEEELNLACNSTKSRKNFLKGIAARVN